MRLFHSGLFLLLLLLSGCTSEHFNICSKQGDVTFTFHYITREGDDLFLQKAEAVDLIVFDANGRYYTHKRIGREALNLFPGVTLSLDPGNYYVICWANVLDNSLITDFTSSPHLSESYVKNVYLPQGVAENGDRLYFAPELADYDNPQGYELTVVADESLTKKMYFTPAHKTVEVYVKGYSNTQSRASTGLPDIEMTDVAGGYNFNLEQLTDRMLYHQRTQEVNTEQGTMALAQFHAPLVKSKNTTLVHIKNPDSGYTDHSLSLEAFIEENQIDLTLADPIQILVEFKDTSVSISLPDWSKKPVEPDF